MGEIVKKKVLTVPEKDSRLGSINRGLRDKEAFS